jgi:hypothetical protein
MEIADLRTNALAALKANGHKIPATASCVVNIGVAGTKTDCAVLFVDSKSHRHYFARFDAQGQVSEVYGGPIRHGTIGPKGLVQTLPKSEVNGKQ